MDKNVDLTKILMALKKQWKILIILPVIFIILSLLISFMLPAKYEASTQVLINQKKSDKDFMAQEVQSNIQLVNTYKEIIQSPRILDTVVDKNKKYTYDEFKEMLNVTNEKDSQIININVTANSKKEAEKNANLVANTVEKQMPKIMEINNVSILSQANSTAEKVFPKPLFNALTGFILGLMLAISVILLKVLLDQHIRTEADVEDELGLPILGSIQKIN